MYKALKLIAYVVVLAIVVAGRHKIYVEGLTEMQGFVHLWYYWVFAFLFTVIGLIFDTLSINKQGDEWIKSIKRKYKIWKCRRHFSKLKPSTQELLTSLSLDPQSQINKGE